MSARNGRLARSELAPVPGGFLRKDAAAAWNAMCAAALDEGRPVPRPRGKGSSYRTFKRQVFWRCVWTARGTPGNAAIPGTSDHGEGIAVDVPEPAQRNTIDAIGAKYGWQKRWSDAAHEPWHFKWRVGDYPAVRAAAFGAEQLLTDTNGVSSTSRPLTEGEASALLRRDLDHGYAPPVNRANTTLDVGLSQNEFDAVVCAVYNLGPGILDRGRTMGDALRSKDRRRIADAFLVYVNDANGKTLEGLVRRRRLERKLFLSQSRPTMAAWLTPVELRRVVELDAIRRGSKRPAHPDREDVLVRELHEAAQGDLARCTARCGRG